jgi:DNA-binding NarL/FixJ family response regulator
MKILIVEDDENKLDRISQYLGTLPGKHHVIQRKSYKSGWKVVSSEPIDLVLLDMSLPIFEITSEEDGFEFEPFAGRDLLSELKRNRIKTKVLVVTQFEAFGEGSESMKLPELDVLLRQRFPDLYLGSVFYTPSQTGWKDAIGKHLEALC